MKRSITKSITKKNIQYRLLNLGISIFLGIFLTYGISYINAIRYNHSIYYYRLAYLLAIVLSFVLIESLGLISRKIDKNLSWYNNFKKRYWQQVFFIVPYSFLFWILSSLFITFIIAGDKTVDGFEITMYFIIGIAIGWFYCNVQLLYYWLTKKQQFALNKLMFEKEDVIIKYKSLKDQISPHFLFNNLHTLHGLIQENQTLAANFVLKLSDIYRYVLQVKDQEVVSLKSEIEFIEKYLDLMKIRYGANLITNISTDIDCEKYYMPPLALQTLVENVQKHNCIDKDNRVEINIYNQNNDFLIIKNNLNKATNPVLSLNSGLMNLKNRYKYLTNSNIEIFSNNTSFTVKVPLIHID